MATALSSALTTICLGATDDGVGVISILHVIKSFTRPKAKGGKRIQRGLIALLNNGEEDYLVFL